MTPKTEIASSTATDNSGSESTTTDTARSNWAVIGLELVSGFLAGIIFSIIS